jgi:CheY-like chemotaxis protein
VVLTSSDRKDDIQRAYALHTNAYITKPPDFDGYTAVIGQIATCRPDRPRQADQQRPVPA